MNSRTISSWPKYWASRLTPAPVFPMSCEEMEALGWDACDVILVTGDAFVDHPSFGVAVIARGLEAQGYRVGIIAQPDWQDTADFMRLGCPTLFFGVTAGNMDSMVNRYTADRRIRTNDAYTPDGAPNRRPDRSTIVYSQRLREAFQDVPIVMGGIECSLRRLAHYDYWSDKVRRSILADAKADLLVYGSGDRQVTEIAYRLSRGEPVSALTDIRGTAVLLPAVPEGYAVLDSTSLDAPGRLEPPKNPYAEETACGGKPVTFVPPSRSGRAQTAVRIPSYSDVRDDPILYAHASRVFHLETNPFNARPLVQRHGDRELWVNPPALPLSMPEMDWLFDRPFTRRPHPAYGKAQLPAWEMIRFSVNIMRGCFGGCTFCSLTEHEGRIVQNRSEDSIIREIETIRDTMPEFTGVISDLGGPTANMYRLACSDPKIEAVCRKLSCVFPDVCPTLGTSHDALIHLYRRARALPGVKKVAIASGVRYDLAVRAPEYVRELTQHHVGGYLKIAPEHTESGPLSHMMKPGIGTFDRFRELFDRYSGEAGKEQYLIPYFIAAHPGTTDEDMLNVALWLKRNDFRPDQVQAFLPTPMTIATAMYHTGRNPLKKVNREGDEVPVPRGLRIRRLHKAFLRYHDPENWPLLREALKRMGREDLIGNGKRHLVPAWQPAGTVGKPPPSSRSAATKRRRETPHRAR